MSDQASIDIDYDNILEKYNVSEMEFEKSYQDFFGMLKEFKLFKFSR